MNSYIKSLVEETLKEILAGGPYVDGNATFRGGPYGFGNKAQIEKIDPNTVAIEKKEQEEVNQNVEDQDWIHGQYHLKHQNEEVDLKERSDADKFYMDLPGYPRMNAIEAPVQHLPDENFEVSSLKKAAGSGTDNRADGTEQYVVDMIVDELDGIYGKKLNLEGTLGGVTGQAYQQQSALPPFDAETETHEEETLGHMSLPKADESPIGGLGTVLFPRKFVPDGEPQESNTEDEDMDSIPDRVDMDMRSKLEKRMQTEGKKKAKSLKSRHPKKYTVDVPSGARMHKKAKEAMKALNELSVMLMQAGHSDAVNTIDRLTHRVKEEMEVLDIESLSVFESAIDEDAIDEKYASKAQQRYFHAKAAEGDPEFKKLASEFDSETSSKQFKKLPEKAPKKEYALREFIERLFDND